MPEPITTGALVAAALSAGAGALGKEVVGAAVKDAYAALKAAVGRWAAPNVEQLEAKPDSDARAGVLAELVDEQPEAARTEVRALAEALRDALVAEGRGAVVDNRITVIADRGSIAAGRDVNLGALPPKPG